MLRCQDPAVEANSTQITRICMYLMTGERNEPGGKSGGKAPGKPVTIPEPARKMFLLIHESPLTDALFLLVSKSDEVTTT